MFNKPSKGVISQYIASLSAGAALIVPGVSYGWTSPYLPKLLSNSSDIPTTSSEGAWCAILPVLGGPLGAVMGALLIDKIGRKSTVLLMTPIQICACAFLALAKNIWLITAIRYMIGFTDGLLFTVLPTYVAETCQPERRGLLSAYIAVPGMIGMLFINMIGPITSIFTSSLIIIVFPVFHFLIFLFMPESPYYYIKKFDLERAEISLKKLRGTENIQTEFEALCKAVKRQEESQKGKISDLFTVASNRRACFIFVILCLANKFSGKTPIIFYCAMIFQEAGSSLGSSLSAIIFSLVEIVTVVLTICFVDRFGKRLLIIISTIGCFISLLALAIHFYLKSVLVDYALGWLPLLALLSYNVLFNIGLSFGQVSVLSELFPTSVKGIALCGADTFSMIMAAVSSKFFQVTKDEFGIYTPFFCFAGCCAFLLIFIIKYLPETKGKSLEEIQIYLISKCAAKLKQKESEQTIVTRM